MPEVKPKLELTSEEMKTISNLLYTGKWNLSVQESNQVITPLINKLAKLQDSVGKLSNLTKPKN